ncbi:MAG: hypothetical protein JNL34_05480 [Anaerolineae bacterium]|nr:hypothetical protein [Anaerolineae bacterium]
MNILRLAGIYLLLVLAVCPVGAQDEEPGVIIQSGSLSSALTLNPILAGDAQTGRIVGFLFPAFLNANVAEGVYSAYDPPFAAGGIVDTWEIDETGKVYTFHLREGLTWNDGDPIDAADVLYTWHVIQAGAEGVLNTPASFVIDPTGQSGILDVTAVDDHTVQVTFAAPECTMLGYAAGLGPLPSHVLPADLSQFEDSPEILNPTVTQGMFNFIAQIPTEQVSLGINPGWFDAPEEMGNLAGYILKSVPDATVALEQLLAGEVNLMDGALPGRREELRQMAQDGQLQVAEYTGGNWAYLALNFADPENPRDGLDADGNPIDQGHHPIFGDARVRQAVARGIDMDAIVSAALLGEAERMNSFIIPSSWAYNHDLPLIARDLGAATDLLDEAGWTDSDGDGIREAHGALYAEEGTPLRFSLFVVAGNQAADSAALLIKDQLSQIGIEVDMQSMDFGQLLAQVDAQTFDSFILGWSNGWPDDPDATQLFTPASDVIGGGSNFTSWNNPEFTALNQQAKTVPGCDLAERAALYAQMQRIFQEDLPYVPMLAITDFYVANNDIAGFAPYPRNLYWNMRSWDVRQPGP